MSNNNSPNAKGFNIGEKAAPSTYVFGSSSKGGSSREELLRMGRQKASKKFSNNSKKSEYLIKYKARSQFIKYCFF
jgi:hypothetical protein